MSASGTSEGAKRAPTWQPKITTVIDFQMSDELELLETTGPHTTTALLMHSQCQMHLPSEKPLGVTF